VVDRVHYDKQSREYLVTYTEEDVYSMKLADYARIVNRFLKRKQ